jgi:hypothetical protein
LHTYQIDLLIFKVANIQLIIYCAMSNFKNIYLVLKTVFQGFLFISIPHFDQIDC